MAGLCLTPCTSTRIRSQHVKVNAHEKDRTSGQIPVKWTKDEQQYKPLELLVLSKDKLSNNPWVVGAPPVAVDILILMADFFCLSLFSHRRRICLYVLLTMQAHVLSATGKWRRDDMKTMQRPNNTKHSRVWRQLISLAIDDLGYTIRNMVYNGKCDKFSQNSKIYIPDTFKNWHKNYVLKTWWCGG
jgi:hypothetical protein